MNDSFDLFQLKPSPVLLSLDGKPITQAQLRDRYLKMQNACHPDHYAHDALQQQKHAVSMSARLSAGYQQLCRDSDRVTIWLNRNGVEIDGKTTMPDQSAFMLHMELAEAMEAVNAGDEQVKSKLATQLAEVKSEAMAWFLTHFLEHEAASSVIDSHACRVHLGTLRMIERFEQQLNEI